MDRASLQQKIESILRAEKSISEGPIDAEVQLADLGFDSLDALNLLFILEETFKISIPDDVARKIRTMNDMVGAVQDLLPS